MTDESRYVREPCPAECRGGYPCDRRLEETAGGCYDPETRTWSGMEAGPAMTPESVPGWPGDHKQGGARHDGEFIKSEPLPAMTEEMVGDDFDWRRLALHALNDLRVLGVPIKKMVDVGMSPAVLTQVDEYSREMQGYS